MGSAQHILELLI